MNKKFTYRQFVGLLLLFVITTVVAAPTKLSAAAVDAALSAQEAYVGVPVSMYVRINNAGRHTEPAIPEISGLDVRSAGVPSRSSQTTIINGRRTDRTSLTYAWELTPRREGHFRIPSLEIEVDGRIQHTAPLSFFATKSDTDDLLFVEVDGKQEKIYVGQPIDLNLRILIKPYQDDRFDVTLSARDMWGLISMEHSSWGAFGETLQEMAEERQAVVGREILRDDAEGRKQVYYAYEIPATIYPTRPGQIDTSDVQVVMQYPTSLARSRDFFSAGGLSIQQVRPIVEDAQIPSTQVAAIPTTARPSDYRGAVGHYEIITRANPTAVKAGDPITLHIGIRGDGPMELVQAPPLDELSDFTDQFKVPDESLAGLVEDDVKVFRVSIRPRREGIAQIPAIPLSYFDPQTEKFATAWSEPIAIDVQAADNLALSSIVSAGGRRAAIGDQQTDTEQVSQVSLKHYQGVDLLASTKPRQIWPLLAGLLFAPLLFVAVSVIRFWPRVTGTLGGGRLAARRRAERGLHEAKTADEVAAVMLSYVAERLQLQASGLTRYEAIEALNRHEIKEGASELDELLSECETGCYAGMATREVAALVASGRACLAVIGRQRLSGNDSRWSGYIRKSCSAKAGTTALVLAMCLSWGYSQAEASVTGTFDLTRSQSERMLEEAAHAYERGQAVDGDAATAKESFAEAAHKYQALVDSGIDNGRLYFNLAGAYLQSGDPVRALVNYERAASLMSGDTSVVAGRNHAIFLLTGEKTELEGSLTERALAWNNSLSVNARTIVGIACWSVLWITLAAALCVSLVAWRPIAITAAVVFALCALSLGLQWSDPTAGDRGIVITAATQLREGNGQGFAAVSDSALEPGTCFEIVQRRGGWLQVRTSDGRAGWLATENADLIPSRDWRAI